MTEWVLTHEHGDGLSNVRIESINGVDWHAAPLPYPWHQCFPQTRGWIGLNYTERCACGAIRFSARERWMDRNATRKARKKAAAEAMLPRVQVTCQACGQPYEAGEGSRQAADELCTRCWADALVRTYGK